MFMLASVGTHKGETLKLQVRGSGREKRFLGNVPVENLGNHEDPRAWQLMGAPRVAESAGHLQPCAS